MRAFRPSEYMYPCLDNRLSDLGRSLMDMSICRTCNTLGKRCKKHLTLDGVETYCASILKEFGARTDDVSKAQRIKEVAFQELASCLPQTDRGQVLPRRRAAFLIAAAYLHDIYLLTTPPSAPAADFPTDLLSAHILQANGFPSEIRDQVGFFGLTNAGLELCFGPAQIAEAYRHFVRPPALEWYVLTRGLFTVQFDGTWEGLQRYQHSVRSIYGRDNWRTVSLSRVGYSLLSGTPGDEGRGDNLLPTELERLAEEYKVRYLDPYRH